MAVLIVTDGDGGEHRIALAGDHSNHDAVVEAHGFDPSTVSYSVDDPDADLMTAIKDASNLQELKNALTSDNHSAQARRPGS